MIVAAVVVVALLLRLALGRSLSGLGQLRVRGESLLLAVFVLVFALPLGAAAAHPPRSVVLPIWLGLMLLLAGLCLWNVESGQGFRLMATGVILNIWVIALNGTMPVSSVATISIGGAAGAAALAAGDVFHSAATLSTRLPILGDVLPLPGPPGLRGILSVGDVLMYVGVICVVSFTPEVRSSVRSRLGSPDSFR